MLKDRPLHYSSITELPGRKLSVKSYRMLCLRYCFASQYVDRKRVLEVGCGPGVSLSHRSQQTETIVGVELTKSTLDHARIIVAKHDAVKFLTADAYAIPIKTVSFNVVVVLECINYLDLDVFLEECRRVPDHHGILVFDTPTKDVNSFRPGPLSTSYYSLP